MVAEVGGPPAVMSAAAAAAASGDPDTVAAAAAAANEVAAAAEVQEVFGAVADANLYAGLSGNVGIRTLVLQECSSQLVGGVPAGSRWQGGFTTQVDLCLV